MIDQLLIQAAHEGLTVTTEGERLIVRGPKSAEATVKRLLENKDAVIVALRRSSEMEPIVSELQGIMNKARRPPCPWEWVPDDKAFRAGLRPVFEMVQEAAASRDLDLFHRYVKLFRRVVAGMPALEAAR